MTRYREGRSYHDGLKRAGRHADHTAVAEIAVNERRLARVYDDDGFDPTRLPRYALATGLTPAFVHARNLDRRRMVGYTLTPPMPLIGPFHQEPLRLYRRNRAGAGRDHRLAIVGILHVARREDPWPASALAPVRDDVAGLV